LQVNASAVVELMTVIASSEQKLSVRKIPPLIATWMSG
jgi:hypothetical protein